MLLNEVENRQVSLTMDCGKDMRFFLTNIAFLYKRLGTKLLFDIVCFVL